TDLRPANSAAAPLVFKMSPDYLRTAETPLVAGRNLTWHDDAGAPPVAIVNQLFSRKLFGSPNNAVGRFFKQRDGTRTQVVGVVQDGRYEQITEDPKPVMFLPMLQ